MSLTPNATLAPKFAFIFNQEAHAQQSELDITKSLCNINPESNIVVFDENGTFDQGDCMINYLTPNNLSL